MLIRDLKKLRASFEKMEIKLEEGEEAEEEANKSGDLKKIKDIRKERLILQKHLLTGRNESSLWRLVSCVSRKVPRVEQVI